ncbi:hypothetical protein BV898_13228 [Hypsibius exemplaris]|uniref:Uncharacterized protein n=1 Tax=Hypsibius exemplaris TaxID=2072580 RepID=A0A1W0WBF9_HYPEX|nr:hypothetical protein BV898_13228 [Hypsibius exemplaris]
MVRWFGCCTSAGKDPSKAKKSKSKGGASSTLNGAADGAETLNNHHLNNKSRDAQDGVRPDGEVLNEKVSVVEHPAGNNVAQREKTARKSPSVDHNTLCAQLRRTVCAGI